MIGHEISPALLWPRLRRIHPRTYEMIGAFCGRGVARVIRFPSKGFLTGGDVCVHDGKMVIWIVS